MTRHFAGGSVPATVWFLVLVPGSAVSAVTYSRGPPLLVLPGFQLPVPEGTDLMSWGQWNTILPDCSEYYQIGSRRYASLRLDHTGDTVAAVPSDLLGERGRAENQRVIRT